MTEHEDFEGKWLICIPLLIPEHTFCVYTQSKKRTGFELMTGLSRAGRWETRAMGYGSQATNYYRDLTLPKINGMLVLISKIDFP
jgi:hypothetical protein